MRWAIEKPLYLAKHDQARTIKKYAWLPVKCKQEIDIPDGDGFYDDVVVWLEPYFQCQRLTESGWRNVGYPNPVINCGL